MNTAGPVRLRKILRTSHYTLYSYPNRSNNGQKLRILFFRQQGCPNIMYHHSDLIQDCIAADAAHCTLHAHHINLP